MGTVFITVVLVVICFQMPSLAIGDGEVEHGANEQCSGNEPCPLADVDAEASKNVDAETSKNVDAETSKNVDAEASKNVDTETSKNVDAETSKNVDAETSKNVDAETSKNVDAETSKNVDAETSKNIDAEASKNVDTETSKNVDAETSKNVDTETSKNVDAETSKNVDAETSKNVDADASKNLSAKAIGVEPNLHANDPHCSCDEPLNRSCFSSAAVIGILVVAGTSVGLVCYFCELKKAKDDEKKITFTIRLKNNEDNKITPPSESLYSRPTAGCSAKS